MKKSTIKHLAIAFNMYFLIISAVIIFLIFPLVKADVISLNSGGDIGLIINPDNFIEGFFFTNIKSVSSCGTLSSPNTVYKLSQNLSSTGTCITIAANNITLDCRNYSISYSSLTSGYGLVNNGKNFLKLNNCVFNLTNYTLTNSYAVYVYGGALSNDLENLKITTTSILSQRYTYNYGIYFDNVRNSIINNSNISTISSGYLGYYNHGIYLASGGNNTISGNFINTSNYMGYGISLSSTSTNNVSGNTILTLNANSFGVYLYNTNGNYFYNNSIITYKDDAGADSSYGVYLYSGASNTFRNNNVTTYMAPCFVSYTAYNSNIDTSNLAEGKPVWFNDSLRNYIFQNVNFTNYGQVVCANCQNVTYNNVTIRNDGLFLGKTNNSFVYNSDIISNNSDGIYLFYSKYNLINNTNISETQNDVNALKIRVNSDNNTIQNSYINESTNEMAIYMQDSDNVTFYNNLINSKGSNYAVLMYGSTDYENFTKNVFDTVSWGLLLDSQSSTESYFDKNDFNCGGSYTVNTNRGSNHYLFTDNNFRGDKIYFGVASSSHRYNLTNATNFGGFYYYVQTSNTGQVNWYLDVYVNNSKGNNLENANVSAWNSQSNLKFTELTNSSGWINKKILKDYYQNYTNIYYDHNYTMNTTKFGYFNDSRNFELVNNRVEYVTLYGTPPVITIISPNSTYEYFTLDVDFNISVVDDESISQCYYNINQTTNVSMIRVNDSYFWAEPSLIPGTHNVTFWCNDTSGNWGANSTNFTILNEAAISIQLSPALSWSVNWTLINLPADDLSANGNNGLGATDYYINISAISVTVDLYVKADGDLLNDAWDVLGLGNETYAINTTNSTVPDLDKTVMSTNYVLIGDSLVDGSVVYMKFYLDAPAGQPAGTYTNDLSFKAVMHGQSP